MTIALTIGLSMLILLAQSLKFLDLMISAGAAPVVFFQLLALSLPRLMEMIAPLALGVSILLVIIKLQGDQELIVMQATGVNHWNLARPILKMACCVSAFLAIMTIWLTPMSLATLQSERHSIRAQFSLSLLQEGVFNFFGDDIMVYFDKRDDEGRLINLILHDQRDEQKPYTLLAEKGELYTNGLDYRLSVTNGRRQQLNMERSIVDQLTFSRYEIELPKTIRAIDPRWKEPNERTLMELMYPKTINDYDRGNADSLLVEIHKRLALPFLPFSIAIPILLMVLKTYRPRKNVIVPIITGLILILFIQILSFMSSTLAKDHLFLIPLIYASTIVPALIGLFYLLSDKTTSRKTVNS